MTQNELKANLIMIGWKKEGSSIYGGKTGVLSFYEAHIVLSINGESIVTKAYKYAFQKILKYD